MMRILSAPVLILCIAGVVWPSEPTESSIRSAASAQDTLVSYSRDVFPIFEQRCLTCHGGADSTGEVTMEASLDLTTYDKAMVGSEYGTVIEPGDIEASLLVEMITTGEMPDEGDLLEPEQIELITRWVAQGAANN